MIKIIISHKQTNVEKKKEEECEFVKLLMAQKNSIPMTGSHCKQKMLYKFMKLSIGSLYSEACSECFIQIHN